MMLYYLNYDGFGCGVFESQVLTPLALLRQRGWRPRLIDYENALDPPSLDDYRRQCVQELGEPPIILRKSVRCNFIISARQVRRLASLLRRREPAGGTVLLHGRGCFAGYLALKAKQILAREGGLRVRVVTDLRGLVSEEYRLEWADRGRLLRLAATWAAERTRRVEQYVAEHSDQLLCVSQRFREYLSRQYPTSRRRIAVIPTGIERRRLQFDPAARQRFRTIYGLSGSFVVVYCGGGQSWQSPRLMLETFGRIRARIPEAKLLLLTNEPLGFEEHAATCGLRPEDYLILRVEHRLVGEYLSMADCALLVREPHLVNEVASPTKFAEYLSCNLPVAVSPGIGDTAAVIRKYGVGCFTDELEQLRGLSSQSAALRANFQNAVDDLYSWEVHLDKLIAIYQRLLAEAAKEGELADQPALRGVRNGLGL